MHEKVVHFRLVCIWIDWLVLMCRESDEAFLVEEDFEWLTAENENVEA